MSLKAYLSIRLTVEQSGTLPTDGRKDNIILHTVLCYWYKFPSFERHNITKRKQQRPPPGLNKWFSKQHETFHEARAIDQKETAIWKSLSNWKTTGLEE